MLNRRAIIVAAIVLSLTAGVLLYARRHDMQSRRQQAVYDLFHLYSALINYGDAFGHLPSPNVLSTTGIPTSSWRYSIVPFIAASKFPFQPSAPWDSESNRQWREQSDPMASEVTAGKHATIFAIVDDNSAFDGKKQLRHIGDLPGWLWLVVRVSNSQHHWMQPGDLSIDDLHSIISGGADRFGITIGESFYALSADGTVLQISCSAPWDAIRPFLTSDTSSHESRERLVPFVIARATPESKRLKPNN